MLDHYLPFALIKTANPVFRFDMRKRRWPRTEDDLKRFSRNIILITMIVFGLYWAGILSVKGTIGMASKPASITVWAILFATAAITLASDFYNAVITVGGLNRQFNSGEWDLLRLTGQSEENIFKAKQAVAQIRAWRMMTVDTAIHAIGAEFTLMTTLYSWFSYQSRRGDWIDIYLILLVAILMTFYVFEPLWKMRAIVALGMAISAQTQNLTFAILGVLGAVFSMRLLQALVLGILIYIQGRIARYVHNNIEIAMVLSVSIGIVCFFVWGFYKLLARLAARRAFKKAFHTEWVTP